MNYIIVELKTKDTALQSNHTDKQKDILGQKDKHEKRQPQQNTNKLSKDDFQKRRNAISEPDTNKIQDLQDLKNLINKMAPIGDQLYFFDSEATTPSSIVGKRKSKKSYINKPIRVNNWYQPIRHIESYKLTVLQYET